MQSHPFLFLLISNCDLPFNDLYSGRGRRRFESFQITGGKCFSSCCQSMMSMGLASHCTLCLCCCLERLNGLAIPPLSGANLVTFSLKSDHFPTPRRSSAVRFLGPALTCGTVTLRQVAAVSKEAERKLSPLGFQAANELRTDVNVKVYSCHIEINKSLYLTHTVTYLVPIPRINIKFKSHSKSLTCQTSMQRQLCCSEHRR